MVSRVCCIWCCVIWRVLGCWKVMWSCLVVGCRGVIIVLMNVVVRCWCSGVRFGRLFVILLILCWRGYCNE